MAYEKKINKKKKRSGAKQRTKKPLRSKEEELFKSQQMLKLVLNNIPQRVFWKDRNSVYLGGNKSFALDSGFKNPEDLVGKNDFDFPWKKFARLYRADDKQVMKSGQSKLTYEEPLIKYGQKPAWLRTSKIPMRDKRGKVFGILGTYEDITDVRKAEESVYKSEERFRNLARLLPQTVFETDKRGKLTFINRHGFYDFGYSQRNLLKGLKLGQMFMTSERKKAAKEIFDKLKRKNSRFGEYLAIRKDGSVFPAIIYYNYIMQDNYSGGLRGIVVDITEQKQVEQSLKETAAKDETLLGSIADGVIAVDQEGRIILINTAAGAMLGWPKKEALGKKWFEILHKENEKGDVIPPEKSEFRAALVSGITTTTTPPYYYYLRRDGTRFPVDVAVSPAILGGKVFGAINVFRDTTRERELDRAKSDFLSLASHQLRTPLSSMKWIMEMFMESRGLNDKQQGYLRDLYVSNERLIRLVNGLLNVAMIESGRMTVNKKTINIIGLINSAFQSCKPNADKKGQQVKLFIETNIREVKIDPLLFDETMNNLLSNAINYGPNNSVISIKISSDNGNYLIAVHNNGPVIPRADHDRIFGKFYRGASANNSRHIGSGLGLFISKAAVEANGGEIWFKSGAKKGVTFYFTVPRK